MSDISERDIPQLSPRTSIYSIHKTTDGINTGINND